MLFHVQMHKKQYVVLGTIKDITAVTIECKEAGAMAEYYWRSEENVTESETESDIASLVGGLVGSAIGSEVGSNPKKDGIGAIETDAGRIRIIQVVHTNIQKPKSKNYQKEW